jgi:hypothetical protein
VAGNAKAYKMLFRKYKREEIFGKYTRISGEKYIFLLEVHYAYGNWIALEKNMFLVGVCSSCYET